MLKAIDYEILRGVKASGLVKIPLARQPVRVARLIDEEEFARDQFMVHHRTVFLEDRTTGTGAMVSSATTPEWPKRLTYLWSMPSRTCSPLLASTP